ncbi:unnamed protein product [Boreogadus saida]
MTFDPRKHSVTSRMQYYVIIKKHIVQNNLKETRKRGANEMPWNGKTEVHKGNVVGMASLLYEMEGCTHCLDPCSPLSKSPGKPKVKSLTQNECPPSIETCLKNVKVLYSTLIMCWILCIFLF